MTKGSIFKVHLKNKDVSSGSHECEMDQRCHDNFPVACFASQENIPEMKLHNEGLIFILYKSKILPKNQHCIIYYYLFSYILIYFQYKQILC